VSDYDRGGAIQQHIVKKCSHSEVKCSKTETNQTLGNI